MSSLLPSSRFLNYRGASELCQTVCVCSSFQPGCIFFFTQAVSQLVLLNTPLYKIIQLPTKLFHTIFKNHETKRQNLAWLIPVTSILITSYLSYKYYVLTSSPLIKGLIYGVHSFFLMILNFSDSSAAKKEGIITLTDGLKTFLYAKKITHQDFESSDNVGSIATLIFSVTFTIIFRNPILANTLAYPLAAIISCIASVHFKKN